MNGGNGMAASHGRPVIDASKYIDMSASDCGIQRAIDAAAERGSGRGGERGGGRGGERGGGRGGGVVQLPAGRFVLERYLYLRSRVTLRGRGSGTVLAAGRGETRLDVAALVPKGATEIPLRGDPAGLGPEMLVFLWPGPGALAQGRVEYYKVRDLRGGKIILDRPCRYEMRLKDGPWASWGLHTYLTSPAVKGRSSVTVANPELLRPGDAVKLTGEGDIWGHHFNVVTAIEGNKLTLARPLTIDAAEGLVQHAFAMITADGEKDIGVSDLVIAGWNTPRLPRWVGMDFVLSGIHTVRCDRITIRNVEVRHWSADGISIQRGRGAVVDHCAVISCRGRGFHPGTTFDQAEFTNLRSIGNGGDGFYYCWYNTNVNLRNSLIKDNLGHGIGGLGDPGDRRAIIEGNVIEGNGLSGIEINGGGKDAGTVIRNNVIRDNSSLRAGAWPGIAIYPTGEPAGGYVIESNTIAGTLAEATQLVGIEERNGRPVRAEVSTGGHKKTVDRIADGNVIRANRFAGHGKADIIVVGPATVLDANRAEKIITAGDAGDAGDAGRSGAD